MCRVRGDCGRLRQWLLYIEMNKCEEIELKRKVKGYSVKESKGKESKGG